MNLIGNINAIPFMRFRGRGGVTPISPFPSIPGMIARYSALGLTNEQMKENPVWVDKTGNGHDLQMKNFLWGGMSGVGGYSDENYQTFYKFTLDNYVFIASPPGVKHMNFTFRVTGLQPGNKLTLAFFGTTNTVYGTWDKDGIYTVDADIVEAEKPTYFYNGYGATRGEFTIEILPLYPGAIVFDGVDDYGTCDNFPILTKEKGYTVVALRSIIDKNIPGYLLSNSAGSNQGAFIFERTIDSLTASFGKSSPITVNYNNPLTYQTTSKYNQKSISVGELLEGGKSLVVGRNSKEGNLYANAAIWELVFLDHDATEEELTKIKDYFVKTYPWLFFDQAWTVTGKTNEDEDRATIANITGNGNDLVLSNFGFSGNSGYGSYPFGMNVWNPDYIADQPYGTVHYPNDSKSYTTTVKNNATNFRIKFRLRELPEGKSFLIRVYDMNDLNTILKTYTYMENGIHEFVYNDPNKPARIILYNGNTPSNMSEFYLDIIPEYEGYLVTDGVDDRIRSSSFLFGNDFTVVGEWEFLQEDSNVLAGFNKNYTYFVLYNYTSGVNVYVKNGKGTSIRNTKTLKAVTSEGLVCIDFNSEQKVEIADKVEADLPLYIAYNGNNHTKMAFKNLAIYPTILSKDDCIKAYNYLQTFRSKSASISTNNYILKEDGGRFLKEDEGIILTEQQ